MGDSIDSTETESTIFFTESETDSSNKDSRVEEKSLLKKILPTKKSSLKSKICNHNNESSHSKSNQHSCSKQCVVEYPLHFAARRGRYKELQKLLDDPTLNLNPKARDNCTERTPLHYAASVGNVKEGLICIRTLLKSPKIFENEENEVEAIRKYTNIQDSRGETALHIAANNEATELVIELLKNHADFNIVSKDGSCPLRLIYNKTPNAMEEAMNQSIYFKEHCACVKKAPTAKDIERYMACNYKSSIYVCLDFYPIMATRGIVDEDELDEIPQENTRSSLSPKKALYQETGFIYGVNRDSMATETRRKMLTNPLVQSFLYIKWQKIMWYCKFATFFNLAWLSLYIWMIVNICVVSCPYTLNPSLKYETTTSSFKSDENGTDEIITRKNSQDSLLPRGTHCEINPVTSIVALITLFLSTCAAIKEVFQFYRLRMLYIKFENIGQCIVLAFIFFTLPKIGEGGSQFITSAMYQLSAFGIFLAWTLILCQLAKLPRIIIRMGGPGKRHLVIKLPDHGIYVEILSRVFKNFLVFIIIFSSLLISFVFAFGILLPNTTGFASFSDSALKVLTMMTGELNYEDIFYNDEEKIIYPVSSHIMYALFIMVATIILFNLLIGFTVSDIQGLQKDAEINQLSNKLEQMFLMESFLLSTLMRTILACVCKIMKLDDIKVLNKIMVIPLTSKSENFCYHTDLSTLPRKYRTQIRDIASKNCCLYSSLSQAKILPRNNSRD